MLIEFTFSNYRSFRDKAFLSMEPIPPSARKEGMISRTSTSLLPVLAIYGKNGGGKSNVIRAFWLAVQFIRNAQRTQYERAPIPVQPFALNDSSAQLPTSFAFVYVLDGVEYTYGFSATQKEIIAEYLYHAPKGRKALVFSREKQTFIFTTEKKKRRLISGAVAKNQLYFAVACTMNETACISAMRWFRDHVFFSRDFADFPRNSLQTEEGIEALGAIRTFAKQADVDIQEMAFSMGQKKGEPSDAAAEETKTALAQFLETLIDAPNDAETKLRAGQMRAVTFHKGIGQDGSGRLFELSLADESDGTRRLLALAPSMERVLAKGGVLLADGLEKGLHPLLVRMIVSRFQNAVDNPNHAQLIFTTHDTELLNMEGLRGDQFYFVDKDRETGVSTLYSIGDLDAPANENVRKGYLLGKYGAIPNVSAEEPDREGN